MVDTYRIRIQETFADLSNNTEPTLSGNQPDTYNYWNVQYHNGILIVREEADSRVQGYFDTGAGASVPITLDYKYTSTLTSTTADPPDAPAPGFSFE
jgi:hypothetical protein